MRTPKKKNARRIQRVCQTVSLLCFLGLLALTVAPLADIPLPPDLFLRLDPLIAALIPLTARQWIHTLWPGLSIALLAFFVGRIFCGYICPMGITLDLGRILLTKNAGTRRTAKAQAAPAAAQAAPASARTAPASAQAAPASTQAAFVLAQAAPASDLAAPASAPAEQPKNAGRVRPASDWSLPALPSWLRHVKYLLLAAILGAALLGVNASFWASPISLITRFYALLVHALLTLAGNEGLALLRPLFEALNWTSPGYWHIPLRRFDTLYCILGFFGLLFWLERVRPRFWCRYLCPAGALLALCSLRPLLWRRSVHSCSGCGRCARHCPMEGISASGQATLHGECLSCRHCVDQCPVQGTAFLRHSQAGQALETLRSEDAPSSGAVRGEAGSAEAGSGAVPAALGVEAPPRQPAAPPCGGAGEDPLSVSVLPSRRAFLFSAGAGAVYAAMQLSGANSLLREEGRGLLWPAECIRPPGSLPEPDFLDRCIRCGQCMKVCPTNGLQPSWFSAGPEGLFSPVLAARRGPCEPDCNACGAVCPTGAIQALPLEEKRWAKLGTAVIQRTSCLAWAEDRRCVVCEEVCPYEAIASVQAPGAMVTVPVVRAARCYGCGYCEQYCPVRVSAIVVQPLNALRLTGRNYQETGRSIGLSLLPTSGKDGGESAGEALPERGLPPGFTEE